MTLPQGNAHRGVLGARQARRGLQAQEQVVLLLHVRAATHPQWCRVAAERDLYPLVESGCDSENLSRGSNSSSLDLGYRSCGFNEGGWKGGT